MQVATGLAMLAAAATASAQTAEEIIAAYETRIEAQQAQLDAMRAELDALKERVAAQEASAVAEAPPAPTAPPEPAPDAIERKSKVGSVKLSGRLHRVLMNVDDGLSNTGLFIDSDQGPTMLRVDADRSVSDEFRLGGTIEFGVQNNRSFRVSQDDPNPGTDILVRIGEIVADHDRYGKVSFGRGFAAAWAIAEVDLSGTVPAALMPVGMLAPSLKFANSTTGQLTDLRVNQYFTDTQRLLLTDRLRYDSVSFGGGARLSASVAPDSRWDAALRYFPTPDTWSIRAALTYQSKPFQGADDRVDILFAARHEGTGLSLSGTWADTKLVDGRRSDAWVIKGGWLTQLNDLGPIGFSVDYYVANDVLLDGDQGESVGLFFQQQWEKMGLDLYGGYRIYDITRSDLNLHELNLLTLGARYSF